MVVTLRRLKQLTPGYGELSQRPRLLRTLQLLVLQLSTGLVKLGSSQHNRTKTVCLLFSALCQASPSKDSTALMASLRLAEDAVESIIAFLKAPCTSGHRHFRDSNPGIFHVGRVRTIPEGQQHMVCRNPFASNDFPKRSRGHPAGLETAQPPRSSQSVTAQRHRRGCMHFRPNSSNQTNEAFQT